MREKQKVYHMLKIVVDYYYRSLHCLATVMEAMLEILLVIFPENNVIGKL